MKKIIFLKVIFFITINCSGDKESLASAQEKGLDLNGLKFQKEEMIKQINILKKKLKDIDQQILQLDPDEKLPIVTSYKIIPENFNHHIEVQGNIKTRQNVLLYPEYSGSLIQIYVKEGQNVKKGTQLAQIDDAGLRNKLEQLKIQLNLSKITYERQQRLWDKNIGSEMQLLNAKTTYQSQLESITQLKKQLLKTQIRAPFSGTIDEIIANTGSNLIPGQTPVFRVVNLNNMYVEASIPERYISEIKLSTEAIVEIPVLRKTYSTQIRQIGNFINPNNRSFRVEAPLVNSQNNIKPNLTCKLKIKDYSNPNALMIPLGVIKENSKGDKYIFKLEALNKKGVYITKKTFIELGKKSIDKVEVTKGIKLGELILNEGTAIVDENQRVREIE
jgi:membrane fusion protein (multidrug efflux system)